MSEKSRSERPRYSRVFCLEGDWDGALTSRSSVRPMLELLEGLGRIEYVHRDVGTRAELKHYLGLWADRDRSVKDYYVLYLAFHGKKNQRRGRTQSSLWISDAPDGSVSLADLAECLGPGFDDVVVHFGSCWMLAADPEDLDKFIEDTDVRAIAGYRTRVEWARSAAMDLLFFDHLADCDTWDEASEALLGDPAVTSLRTELGFEIHSAGS